jgi:16S rRNA (guanine(1405)-N(7))-methyltransferase
MTTPDDLTLLMDDLLSSAKYQQIEPGLLERIGQSELAKRHNLKEAIKTTRSKLHQIATSFQPTRIDYPTLSTELSKLPHETQNRHLQEFCLRSMALHSSTRERLSILGDFYKILLDGLPPIRSIMDLGCGLNPLSIPWMPIARDCKYFAFDIFSDMMDFNSAFLKHIAQKGKAKVMDLSRAIPKEKVDVAFLFKLLPTLDQLDKHRTAYLLENLPATHLLISYPIYSLGGKSKGMLQSYENQLRTLTINWSGEIKRFEFTSELVFLLSRNK